MTERTWVLLTIFTVTPVACLCALMLDRRDADRASSADHPLAAEKHPIVPQPSEQADQRTAPVPFLHIGILDSIFVEEQPGVRRMPAYAP